MVGRRVGSRVSVGEVDVFVWKGHGVVFAHDTFDNTGVVVVKQYVEVVVVFHGVFVLFYGNLE